MPVDFSTDHGSHVRELLETEPSIWLTTVSPTGEPQPNPVWFVWEDDAFLIWTTPSSARLRNIAANPRVSLSFASDPNLDQIAVFNGTAEIDDSIPMLIDHPGYLEKYRNLWEPIGMSPETATTEYTTRLRIRPSRLRGY